MAKNKKREDGTPTPKYLLILALSALGVVYGDIGTSPLYAFRECFHGSAIKPTDANVLGILSLIFWALILVISVKYLLIILRADNGGEGGILALMELVLPEEGRKRAVILVMGLFGAALLYGDGAITPAISVLSAIEGLNVATHFFEPYVVMITIAILLLLFLFQHRGTGRVGLIFGPVMLLWFLVLAALGIASIIKNPAVLAAVNPLHAIDFFFREGFRSFMVLGAVFLVVTGGEALYADIGHFGRAPIRLVWFSVVLPCLLLNYFGQGALLMADPSVISNPFYHLAPSWALYPLVGLATCATVIASQAIISGSFSLTFQALQLGYLPRMTTRHTSKDERSQIYIPQINWLLFFVTAGIVLSFQASSNLAAAYGVAVSTTMVITILLGFVAMRDLWNWRLSLAILAVALFLIVDLSFFTANLLKIVQGGWLPLLLGSLIYLLMTTWIKGQDLIAKQIQEFSHPLSGVASSIDHRKVKSISGTAIYMTKTPLSIPPAFRHNLEHNKVLHRRTIFLSVGFKNVPYVRSENRLKFERLDDGFYRILVRYGFMNRPDIPAALRIVNNKHLQIDMDDTTFFLGREAVIASGSTGMSLWRDMLFIFMNNNAERATKYFNLPSHRVFEIGVQVKV